MAKAATSPALKAAFEKHLGETEGQVKRLEQVFEASDVLFAAFDLALQPRHPPVLTLAPAPPLTLLFLELAQPLLKPLPLLLEIPNPQLASLDLRSCLVDREPDRREFVVQLPYVPILDLEPPGEIVPVLNLFANLLADHRTIFL